MRVKQIIRGKCIPTSVTIYSSDDFIGYIGESDGTPLNVPVNFLSHFFQMI